MDICYHEKTIVLVAEKACARFLETRCLLLSGPVGVGKTALARAIISKISPHVEKIPSPSFPLMLRYESSWSAPVWHIDLYRLSEETAEKECHAIGMFDILETDYALIEWPERLLNPPSGTWIRMRFTHQKNIRIASFSSMF